MKFSHHCFSQKPPPQQHFHMHILSKYLILQKSSAGAFTGPGTFLAYSITFPVSLYSSAPQKIVVFFGKTLKGGGGVSTKSKISLSEKLRFFWIFFKRGGRSYLFQKGVIIKRWGFLDIFAKRGGSHPIQRDFIMKKSFFFAKGRGVAFKNFLI